MILEPIGIFHGESKHPYEVRRQGSIDNSNSLGEIRLNANLNFEQALEDLGGFERIWIIFQFHKNSDWKPKVMPPRGPRRKRGVFATRAPYRPNALGLSCVRLIAVEGLRVIVEGHDLLDQTPVLDIKPYLPYADAFPQSCVGWLASIDETRWSFVFSALAEQQISWLDRRGTTRLREFIFAQLEFEPFDARRKRIEKSSGANSRGTSNQAYRLAYRTWRISFRAYDQKILIEWIESAYEADEIGPDREDPYHDKALHREFNSVFLAKRR